MIYLTVRTIKYQMHTFCNKQICFSRCKIGIHKNKLSKLHTCIYESNSKQHTPWIFGCDWLRRLARWSHASLVLCHHTVLVLAVFNQLGVFICHLSDEFLVDLDPSSTRCETSLKPVARDGSPAVRGRGLPRDGTAVFEDLAHLWALWGSGKL